MLGNSHARMKIACILFGCLPVKPPLYTILKIPVNSGYTGSATLYVGLGKGVGMFCRMTLVHDFRLEKFHDISSAQTILLFHKRGNIFIDCTYFRRNCNFCNLFTHQTLKKFVTTRSSVFVRSRSNWNLEVLVFDEKGKPENPEKNLLKQGRGQITNSTHAWRPRRGLNPGQIDEMRVLSPLGNS